MNRFLLKLFLVISVFCAFSSVKAQGTEDDIFYGGIISDDVNFSGFGSIYTNISLIGGEKANFIGGGGAIVIAERYIVGAFGSGLMTKPQLQTGVYKDNYLGFSQMGVLVGFVFLHEKKLHPIISVQGAVGGLSLTSSSYLPVRDFYDDVTAINPIIEIEYKATKYIRLSVGGQYSYITGVSDLDEYSNADFQNAGVFIGLKVGWE